MKKNENYFVRIDYKALCEKPASEILEKHIAYLSEISKETEFYGGGFLSNPGGMIIFQADDFKSAEEICDNDPIIKSGYYQYILHQWKIVLHNSPV